MTKMLEDYSWSDLLDLELRHKDSPEILDLISALKSAEMKRRTKVSLDSLRSAISDIEMAVDDIGRFASSFEAAE